MLELMKVMVQPVLIERNEEGKIVGEKIGEPTALFTAEGISDYVDMLNKEIEAQNGRNGLNG